MCDWRSLLPRIVVDEVLAPAPLERAVQALGQSGRFRRERIGRSADGHELVVTWLDRDLHAPCVLFYGYPDPGEGLGASGALAWLRVLSTQPPTGLRWALLPVLDQDGQVDREQLRRPIWSKTTRVDLVAGAPRPQARALALWIDRERPRSTYALHDEWHCAEERPLYYLSDRPLSEATVDALRAQAAREQWPLDDSYNDPAMGVGFLALSNVPGDFNDSVWHRAGRVGRPFACELSERSGRSPSALARLQLEAGPIALDAELGCLRCPHETR